MSFPFELFVGINGFGGVGAANSYRLEFYICAGLIERSIFALLFGHE